jgi:hypothetical protein
MFYGKLTQTGNVYIKVHNTTSDIGHKPAITYIFNTDNATSGKSCFPFEARNGLFTGKQ